MNPLDYILPKSIQPSTVKDPQSQEPEFDSSRLGPKQVMLAWEAKSRPVKQFASEKLLRAFGMIGIVFALFLVLMQEYFLIVVVASVVFVSQVLAKIPPENVKYEISNHGIFIDSQMYYWHEFRRFFFFQRDDQFGVAVDLINGFPSRLFLAINTADKDKIKTLLNEHMTYLESEPESFLDRTYKSVTQKFVS